MSQRHGHVAIEAVCARVTVIAGRVVTTTHADAARQFARRFVQFLAKSALGGVEVAVAHCNRQYTG